MSEPVKRGAKYRHEIMVKGVRHSGTFATKTAARIWAADLLKGSSMAATVSGRTVKDILDRYKRDVSSKKNGEKWESLRLAKMTAAPIGSVALEKLAPSDVAKWRDDRLKEVGDASVRREMNLLNHALSKATKEWGWLKYNPSKEVERPKDAEPRDRLYTDDEVKRLLLVTGEDLTTVTGRVGVAFQFAIQTGMRAGEIVKMLPSDLFLDEQYLKVRGGKTISAKRDVPLSKKAIELLRSLPKTTGPVFGMDSAQLDPLFRKCRDKALIKDATFHDTRHTACTWLCDKLSLMPLAKMMGIRDLRTLQIVYYNPKATDLAPLLG